MCKLCIKMWMRLLICQKKRMLLFKNGDKLWLKLHRWKKGVFIKQAE